MKKLILLILIGFVCSCSEKETEIELMDRSVYYSNDQLDSIKKSNTDSMLLRCVGEMSISSSYTILEADCKIDTVKGILYRAIEAGSYSIETGYYIVENYGMRIGYIPVMGQEDAPIWIPGRFLRKDEIDEKGNYVHEEFQEQYNSGYFTDAKFREVQMSSVYGLLVERKKK